MCRFEELEKWLLDKATGEFNDVASHHRYNESTLCTFIKDRRVRRDDGAIHLMVDNRVRYRHEMRRLNQVILDIKEAILELRRWR